MSNRVLGRPVSSRIRLPDWPERLAELIEERRHTPFQWGTHDCCSLASDATILLCGVDPIAPWRGRYFTEDEAMAIIGPEGLEAFVARLMADIGFPPCPPVMLQRGDWAMVTLGNQLLNGIHLGDRVAVPGESRLHFLPPENVSRGWAI